MNDAADRAVHAPKPTRDTVALYVYSPDVDPTSDAFATAAAPEGRPDTMVAAINRTLKDEMARDPRIVVFGEDVADCSRSDALTLGLRKGRRLQGHARPAADVRQRPRLQLAARRSQHHRPRHRHGHARSEARRRNPVLRLHLARHDADPRRADDAAVSIQQCVLVPGRHPRADRRLLAGRRAVSQPVRREHLRALPGHPHRVSVERAGRGRAAANGDPLRRSRPLPRAQTSLPPDLQQRRVPGRQLHGAVRQSRPSAAKARTSSSSPGARSCSDRCSPRSRPRRTASA